MILIKEISDSKVLITIEKQFSLYNISIFSLNFYFQSEKKLDFINVSRDLDIFFRIKSLDNKIFKDIKAEEGVSIDVYNYPILFTIEEVCIEV